MAYVILPSRRKRPDNFVLDHSHPLAQGLRFCGIPQRREPLLRDSSLLRKDGVFTNMTIEDCTFDPSISEFALSFNGVSKKVLTPSIGSISKDGPWTVSFFILNPTGSFGCASSYGESVSFYPHWQIHGNDPNGFLHATTFNVANTRQRLRINVDRSVWAHIALVRLNSSSISLYGNAINAALAGTWDPSEFGEDRLIIGDRRTINSSPFTGRVARFCIHNRSLSQEEIAILANRTDPMLAGMIRDKKPAPKHWFMPIPDDCKVKSVVPVRASGSPFGVGVQLPRVKRRPDVFELDYSHPLAQGLIFGMLGSRPGSSIAEDSSINAQRCAIAGDLRWTQFLGRNCLQSFSAGAMLSAVLPTIPAATPVTICWQEYALSLGLGTTYGRVADGTIGSLLSDNNLARFSFEGSFGFDAVNINLSSSLQLRPIHLCAVYQPTSFTFYENTVQRHSAAGTKTARSGAFYLFNNSGGTRTFNGIISDFCIYNRALSPAEIALLANRTDPMLDGLIRPSKPRTIYSFASKHNIVGTQDANNLNWTWGE